MRRGSHLIGDEKDADIKFSKSKDDNTAASPAPSNVSLTYAEPNAWNHHGYITSSFDTETCSLSPTSAHEESRVEWWLDDFVCPSNWWPKNFDNSSWNLSSNGVEKANHSDIIRDEYSCFLHELFLDDNVIL